MAIQSFLLLLVVISAGAGLAAGAPSSVITSTCSAVAKDTARAKAVYDDCVGVLSAYPEAASAVDLRGVAIAAADLTAANVTNMEAFIQQLIGNLQSCLEAYKEMSGTVAGGIQDLRAGRIDAGVNKLRYAENMPEQCFLPYVYAKNQSPIDKEITATMALASTATSIATLLKSAHKV
ncbi:hypothetical protein ACQ4PT_069863 [Festuca glaucescens]